MGTQGFLKTLMEGNCSEKDPIRVKFSGDTEGIENDKIRDALNAGEKEEEVMDMARRLCRLYRDTKDKELEDLIEDDDKTTSDINVEVAKRLKDIEQRQADITALYNKAEQQAARMAKYQTTKSAGAVRVKSA